MKLYIYILVTLIYFITGQTFASTTDVTFTTSSIKAGDTPGTMTFTLDSCTDCMGGGWAYDFNIDHTPISKNNKGNTVLSIANDAASCIVIDTSTTVTNQYLEPYYTSYFNHCSIYEFTTHITVKNLPVPDGWAGGNLPCSFTINGSAPKVCSVSVPAYKPTPPPQIITDLQQEYNALPDNCGGTESPAFLCSGLFIRGTVASDDYHSWDPSPGSVTSGGVSFSWLRKDSKFNKLAYGYVNGFILTPQQDATQDKIDMSVLCAFPVDGATDHRSDAGCGEYTGHPESTACQSQGIYTADDWYQHYITFDSNHASQCGFGLDSRYPHISDAFNQTILSMAKISTESFNEQNEARIATWAQGIPQQLPLQAFFYLNGSASGLQGAQHDQNDFYQQTAGMVLPIVNITLPQSPDQDVVFSYFESDQVITSSTMRK